MDHANSPTGFPYSNFKEAALKQLKTLSLLIVRRTQEFLEIQKLPYLADKACKIYLDKENAAHQARCRQILRTRLELDPDQLHRFAYTSLGNDLIARLEQFFHLASGQESDFKALLLQMAADPEGLSLLSFWRRFPHLLQLNLEQLLSTAEQMKLLLQATDATVEVIRALAIAEIAEASLERIALNGSGKGSSGLQDIQQSGEFAVKRYSLILEKPQREGVFDQVNQSQLRVICYQPHPLPLGNIPVVIQSHGLASHPEDMATYAEHLASYGYFVAAPQHPGSDAEHVREMLAGKTQEVFKLSEFIDRPQDISDLLNELEQLNLEEFAGRLNLKAVGIMGYSFGAYTAFALAGADIHFEKLEMACDSMLRDLNLSLLLQCQALGLPRQSYNLRDNRVQAILSIDSVGSEVFGSRGIEKVKLPVLLIAGNQDAAAPLVLEQIRLFHWLTSSNYHLALMQGKSHIHDVQRLVSNLELQIKISPQTASLRDTPFEQYTKALSLAFFNQHLLQRSSAIPPLSAEYAAHISCSPFELSLISQKSSVALTQRLQALNNDLLSQVVKDERERMRDEE